MLRIDVQRLAARDQNNGVRGAGEEGRDRRRGLDDLLEVVDEGEQPLVRHVLDQSVVGADRVSDRALDESGIAECLQRNPEDPVWELLDRLGRELERQPGLAASAGARERDQAMLANELTRLLELALPPDERIRLDREVRPIEGLERRKIRVPELVETLRGGEVLEAMVAEVEEVRCGVEQLPRRLREENLPAVARAHDPRRTVHVGTDVALVRDDRLTGVDADPDSHGTSLERGLTVSSGGDRIARPRERDEECVPLGVHLDPAVPREGLAQQPTMLRQHIRVTLAELVQETRRPLDVGEEQRDSSTRKCPHSSIIAQHRLQAKSTIERASDRVPEVGMSEKMWGSEPFWGLGYEWDPDWFLTDRQKELRALLIELCEKEMRANAKRSDDELLFPRRNLELLGEHGFLALTVPEEYGGLGENHVAYSMACETIARYGCASTAMCYVMHIGAVNTIMLRPTPELVDKYIRPLGEGKIGTLSYSDPETGSHFWYPISSGAERSNGGYNVRKKASWTTSAGFADFYVVQTTSPEFSGYDDLSVFVIDGGDVESQPSLWDALGLRGNQSGPLEVPNVQVPSEQLVGPEGDGAASNDESVDPWFLIGSSSVWNGIALGTIDIAKRHTTRKRHVDVGLRVADYPTIQDYVGEAVMDTNASRAFVLSVAEAMDRATDNNTKALAPGEFARADYLHWAWQIKFIAAKNVAHVVDKMLHACGGSGYKRDMELERYLRDAKAGWVMGPTNEVLRQFVGKAVLLGFDSLDYWNQTYNRRAVENEIKKLDADGKRELAETLIAEASEQEAKAPAQKA